jgi:WD40 repeat protein
VRLPRELDTIKAAAFRADGKRLAVAAGTKAYVLDAETGTMLATLTGHEDEVQAIAFSADGTQVLTGSADKNAARWQAETGKLEAVYTGHKEAVTYVAFRPDGKQVATAVKSGEVRLWPLDPVAEMLRRAPRDLTDQERQRYEVPAVQGK